MTIIIKATVSFVTGYLYDVTPPTFTLINDSVLADPFDSVEEAEAVVLACKLDPNQVTLEKV